MDLSNLITRNTTILGLAYTKNTRGAAIAAWVFYGVFGLLLMILAIVVFSITLCVGIKNIRIDRNDCDLKEKLCLQIFSVILNSIAAFCYYYGSNINDLVELYGGQVGCSGDTCVNNNKAAAAFFLAIALLLFFVTPEIIQRFIHISDKTWTTWWYIILDISAVIIKLNTVYSEVSIIIDTDEPCSSRDKNLNGFLIVFTVLIGVAYFFFYFYYLTGTVEIENPQEVSYFTWVGYILSVIVFSTCCLLMFILTDNLLPLGCGFNCNKLNITMIVMDMTKCDLQGFGITNFVLSSWSPGFFALVFLFAICTQRFTAGHAKPCKNVKCCSY